jgi:hypothetical protein
MFLTCIIDHTTSLARLDSTRLDFDFDDSRTYRTYPHTPYLDRLNEPPRSRLTSRSSTRHENDTISIQVPSPNQFKLNNWKSPLPQPEPAVQKDCLS